MTEFKEVMQRGNIMSESLKTCVHIERKDMDDMLDTLEEKRNDLSIHPDTRKMIEKAIEMIKEDNI